MGPVTAKSEMCEPDIDLEITGTYHPSYIVFIVILLAEEDQAHGQIPVYHTLIRRRGQVIIVTPGEGRIAAEGRPSGQRFALFVAKMQSAGEHRNVVS